MKYKTIFSTNYITDCFRVFSQGNKFNELYN